MTSIIFNLWLISFIVVNITDISGVVQHIEDAIARWLNVKNIEIHLLECSYCQTFWLSLLYLTIISYITFETIAITLVFCLLTEPTKYMIYKIKDNIIKLINKI